MNKLRKAFGLFIRVFIVTFCFIIDVKVRADVIVEAVNGRVEFQHNDQLILKQDLEKLPLHITDSASARDLDVQTINGTARFSLDEKKIGIERGSLFSIDKNGMGQLSQGVLFISGSPKDSSKIGKIDFKIQTPQGEVEIPPHSDLFLEVEEGKTQVSVLSGEVNLIDRAAKKAFKIEAGYTSWLGGLLASGQHSHPVGTQPCDLNRIMEQIKPLMGWSEKEFQSRTNFVIPLWKDAVLKAADDSQNAVDNDIKTLNTILEKEKKLDAKKNLEEARLRKLFKEKTIGVPDENKRFPWGTDRVPSSDYE